MKSVVNEKPLVENNLKTESQVFAMYFIFDFFVFQFSINLPKSRS